MQKTQTTQQNLVTEPPKGSVNKEGFSLPAPGSGWGPHFSKLSKIQMIEAGIMQKTKNTQQKLVILVTAPPTRRGSIYVQYVPSVPYRQSNSV